MESKLAPGPGENDSAAPLHKADGGEASDGSSQFSSDVDASWISWFCRLRGNEFFAEVDEAWVQDDFNLCNIAQHVPYYDDALDMILDVESSRLSTLSEEQTELVESAAELLYGFIHARYILTSRGLQAMYAKYKNADFGRCPRVLCKGQPVLPVGQSDQARATTVNVFCPRCKDIFFPKSSRQGNLDGAYFGTTFCHMFLMTYPDLIVAPGSGGGGASAAGGEGTEAAAAAAGNGYVPRVFGFRISKLSHYFGGDGEPGRRRANLGAGGKTTAKGKAQGVPGGAAGAAPRLKPPPPAGLPGGDAGGVAPAPTGAW